MAEPDTWRKHPFLAHVPSDQLDQLEGLLVRRDHAAGETILREGEPSDRVCLLSAGSVGIYKGPEGARLGGVEAETSFGEVGVLSGAPRSATVKAESDAVVWSITPAGFEAFRSRTGVDLFALAMRSHADALGERLSRVSDVAAQWQHDLTEQYRIRVSFGTLFTHVILMMFVYTSALGVLRELSASASSSTLTSSALLGLMALGAAWIMKASGFPAQTFGFSLARWRWVLLDALVWSVLFCALLTLAKAVVLQASDAHAGMALFKPWVSPGDARATWLAYALYVVFSPVQEFVARGLMQGSLTRMLTGRWVPLQAVLVSNAVFCMSHLHLGAAYALAVFVPGLFWGWLYHRQGSLLGVSVSHVVIGLWGTGVLDLASLAR